MIDELDVFVLSIGFVAALLLLTASYLFGARRGRIAREKLREQALRQAREIEILNEKIENLSPEDAKGLKAAIEGALAMLAAQNSNRVTLDLSKLKTDAGQGRNLTALLDKIMETGRFEGVVLSDSEGLALASSTGAAEVERLSAASTRALIMAERLASGGRPSANAVMLQDEAGLTMMFRIFNAQNQRLILATASISDDRATPATLDPAVARIVEMLSAE